MANDTRIRLGRVFIYRATWREAGGFSEAIEYGIVGPEHRNHFHRKWRLSAAVKESGIGREGSK